MPENQDEGIVDGAKKKKIAEEDRITEWLAIRCSPKQKTEILNAIRAISNHGPKVSFSAWALSLLIPVARKINTRTNEEIKGADRTS